MILSKQDVQTIREHAVNYKHQVFLTFVYATGLRLSEALNVKLDHIDGNRKQILVSKGKGSKDLPCSDDYCGEDILIYQNVFWTYCEIIGGDVNPRSIYSMGRKKEVAFQTVRHNGV